MLKHLSCLVGCCTEKTLSSVCVFGSVTSHLTNKVQNATSEDTLPTAGTAAAVSHGFTALHTHSFNSGFQKSVVQRTLHFRGTAKTPWLNSPNDIMTVYQGRGASKEIHIYLQLLVPRSDSIKKHWAWLGRAPNNVTQLPEMLASHAGGDTFAVSHSERITY